MKFPLPNTLLVEVDGAAHQEAEEEEAGLLAEEGVKGLPGPPGACLTDRE